MSLEPQEVASAQGIDIGSHLGVRALRVPLVEDALPIPAAEDVRIRAHVRHVGHEVADVFGYLLRLADVLGISLDDALDEKMKLNAQRYPVQASRGHARKYTELEEN